MFFVFGAIGADLDDRAAGLCGNAGNPYLRIVSEAFGKALSDLLLVCYRVSIQLVKRHDQRLIQLQQRLQCLEFVTRQVIIADKDHHMGALRLLHGHGIIGTLHLIETRHIDQHHIVSRRPLPVMMLNGGGGSSNHVGVHAGTGQQGIDQRALATADLTKQCQVYGLQLTSSRQFLQLTPGRLNVDTSRRGGFQVCLQFSLCQILPGLHA